MKNIILFGIIGLVAGCLSFFIKEFSIVPGIIFGLGIGLYFVFTQKTSLVKFLSFVIVSAAAYHIALRLLGIVNKIPFDQLRDALSGSAWSFFFAGLGGAIILLIGFHSLLSSLNLKSFVILSLLGGLLGVAALKLIPAGQDLIADSGMLTILTVWQTGMALGLGAALNQKVSGILS